MSDTPAKLWGGRFTGATDPLMDLYNASLPYDKKMYAADLHGTAVYTQGLQKLGILSADELSSIQEGLKVVEKEWELGKFVEKPGDEDIHTANERRLGEVIGKHIAGKVHTGRSRNDQVATDMRIFVRETLTTLLEYLSQLIGTIVNRAGQEIDVLMPGTPTYKELSLSDGLIGCRPMPPTLLKTTRDSRSFWLESTSHLWAVERWLDIRTELTENSWRKIWALTESLVTRL